MRKTSKLVSLLLVLGMLFSILVPTATAANTLTFNDVSSDNPYYEAVTNLTAEGIINGFEDGTFKPDEPVTRAQYTKIMCYAQNVGEIRYSEADRAKFPDVDPNHWAIDNITTARNTGIINGYDDGTFKPENSVLYEQAVKMAVCALGYTEAHAIRAGGDKGAYPYGYLNLATKAKLLNKISGVKMGEPLNRGRVAQLIDNMLNADTIDAETGEMGGPMKEETSNRVTVEGRIVSIYGSTIFHDETSGCNKKQIEIEKSNGAREFYGIENLTIDNLNEYLGRNVKLFYEEDGNADYQEANNIVFQNKDWTIPLSSIEGISGSVLKYLPENSTTTKNISLSSSMIVLRNGLAVNRTFSEELADTDSMSGYLTLICSQSKDVADVAMFKTYNTIYVNSQKDSVNHKIVDFVSGNAHIIDDTDRSKFVTIIKDGKISKFSDIPYTCIVSISKSEGEGKYIEVQVSTKAVSGTVTELLDDGGIRLSQEPNKIYKRIAGCTSVGTLAVGANVTLRLDAFGNVGRYEATAPKAYKYGYMTSVDSGNTAKPYIEVMIYDSGFTNNTPSGVLYSLSDKVKIDGETYSISKNLTGVTNKLKAAGRMNASIETKNEENETIITTPTNTTYAQPIRYTTNASGEIDNLLTCASTGINHDMTMNVSNTVLLECILDGALLGQYNVSKTRVMEIPVDRFSETYKTKSASSYFKKGVKYYVQIVNAPDYNNVPEAVYVYGSYSNAGISGSVLSEDNRPMIVTKVIPESTYMDEVRKKLVLTDLKTGTTEIAVYDDGRTGTETVLASVAEGDIVRVAYDDKKLIDAIVSVATAADMLAGTQSTIPKFDGVLEDDYNAPLRLVFGRARGAVSVGTTLGMVQSFSDESSPLTFVKWNNTKVYTVDSSKVGRSDYIYKGGIVTDLDKIMVYTEDGVVQSIVVFK